MRATSPANIKLSENYQYVKLREYLCAQMCTAVCHSLSVLVALQVAC
jgi:hypothetical protein